MPLGCCVQIRVVVSFWTVLLAVRVKYFFATAWAVGSSSLAVHCHLFCLLPICRNLGHPTRAHRHDACADAITCLQPRVRATSSASWCSSRDVFANILVEASIMLRADHDKENVYPRDHANNKQFQYPEAKQTSEGGRRSPYLLKATPPKGPQKVRIATCMVLISSKLRQCNVLQNCHFEHRSYHSPKMTLCSRTGRLCDEKAVS